VRLFSRGITDPLEPFVKQGPKMSIRVRLTISFTALFGAIVIALAVAAYVLLSSDAYRRLDAALQVATGATEMSAEHELNEHSTKSAGEKDLQSVLDEAGTAALSDTQILVREGDRIVAYRPAVHFGSDLRTVPPQILRTGIVNGFRIVSDSFRAPKFNAVYRVYSARPTAPVLARVEQIHCSLFCRSARTRSCRTGRISACKKVFAAATGTCENGRQGHILRSQHPSEGQR